MSSTNIITCRLCQEIFLEPVIFPCGHTFCLECSKKWRKQQRVCPQTGCGKLLGEAVPNLLVKEAAISHHARKSMEANQQQELAFQLEAALQQQQQLFAAPTGMVNHPLPMTSCEANDFYDDDIELQGQQWIGAREVSERKSSRNFQTHRNRESRRGSVSLEQTCMGGHQEKMPPMKKSLAHESPLLRAKDSQQQEVTQLHPSTTRYIQNKAFVRGTRGRRTEIHQMPSQPVFPNRRSVTAMFSSRPREKHMNQHEWGGVWMGDEQQDESQESTELASHPMNKFMQPKKDKSLWSKTKHLFSSNKAKK